MEFGRRLKEQRVLHNLRQEDLAKLLHISRAAVAGYEACGKQPDYNRLLWLADYFQVSTDYLLGNEKAACNGCCSAAIRMDDISLESRKKLYEYKEMLKKCEAL